MEEGDLKKLRDEIDKIDSSLLELFNKRAEIVVNVGKHKIEKGENIYRPEREAGLLNKLCERSKGPLKREEIITLFRNVISSARNLQNKITVATVGPEGTWSHIAASTIFGRDVSFTFTPDVKSIFEVAEQGVTEYAVAPAENSTEGIVNATLDNLRDTNLFIQNEFYLPISHSLMGNKDATIVDAKVIYGHEQALAQCRKCLSQNFGSIKLQQVGSAAEGFQLASKDSQALAVGSKTSAGLYGLTPLEDNITDKAGNQTRFIVVGKGNVAKTGFDKTSFCFQVKDNAGALLSILQPFSDLSINLTSLDARPAHNNTSKYIFFVNCAGHIDDDNMKELVSRLEKKPISIKFLGSYPRDPSTKKA